MRRHRKLCRAPSSPDAPGTPPCFPSSGRFHHTYHNGVLWKSGTDEFHEFHKVLRIAIGHIQANKLNLRHSFQDAAHLLQIMLPTAGAHGYVLDRTETERGETQTVRSLQKPDPASTHSPALGQDRDARRSVTLIEPAQSGPAGEPGSSRGEGIPSSRQLNSAPALSHH